MASMVVRLINAVATMNLGFARSCINRRKIQASPPPRGQAASGRGKADSYIL
jgi:hypothetical protein